MNSESILKELCGGVTCVWMINYARDKITAVKFGVNVKFHGS